MNDKLFDSYYNILNLDNPWDDRDAFYEAAQYCEQIQERLLKKLTHCLNDIHGVSKSVRYWRIILGPWLFHYLELVYDRYCHVNRMIENGHADRMVIMSNKSRVTPRDIQDFYFWSIINDDYYSFLVSSQILEFYGYSEKINRYLEVEPQDRRQTDLGLNFGNYKHKAIGLVERLTIFLGRKSLVQGQITFNEYRQIAKASKLKIGSILWQTFPSGLAAKADPDHPGRRKLNRLTGDDEFERLVISTLARNFPSLYLEGYAPARKHVLGLAGERPPKALCSVGGLINNEIGKFYAAELASAGSKILNVQHGGGYGMSLVNETENHERKISDVYFCWGWAVDKNDSRLKNVPGIKLAKTNARNKGESNQLSDILLVGTAGPRYVHRFSSFPVGRQWLEYFENTFTFLDAIGMERFHKIIYRPYNYDYEWNIIELFEKRFQDLRIDDHSVSFSDRLKGARLVVNDHPGTCLLECFASNIPVLVFYDKKYWEMRKNAAPYFKKLEDAGILFYKAVDAAEQIKIIYGDIDNWWFSAARQDAVKAFQNHFAMTSSDWACQWTQIIKNESRG